MILVQRYNKNLNNLLTLHTEKRNKDDRGQSVDS